MDNPPPRPYGITIEQRSPAKDALTTKIYLSTREAIQYQRVGSYRKGQNWPQELRMVEGQSERACEISVLKMTKEVSGRLGNKKK